MTCAFVNNRKIDSYLKLRILLTMHEHSQQSLSLDELCEQFFVADRPALEQLMIDLCQQGLLDCNGARWTSSSQPDVVYCLTCLERTFDDPLARQRLLDQIAGH